MAKYKEFTWEDVDHSPSGFIQRCQKSLPLIVVITQGHLGIDDDDIYTYSAGQAYRVTHIKRQARAIFRDVNDQLYSIPANYPLRFLIQDSNKQVNQWRPLASMINELQIGTRLLVENGNTRTFTIGNQRKKIPKLEFEATHTETYLVGNYINNGIPYNEEIIVMPHYVDARIALVNGLQGGTQQDFDKVRLDIAQMSKQNKNEYAEGNPEIMVLDDDPDDVEDYENIKPKQYARCDQFIRPENELTSLNEESGKFENIESPLYKTKSSQSSDHLGEYVVDSDEDDYENPILTFKSPIVSVKNEKAPINLPERPGPKKQQKNDSKPKRRLPAPPPEAMKQNTRPVVPAKSSSLKHIKCHQSGQTLVKSASFGQTPSNPEYVNKVSVVGPMKRQECFSELDTPKPCAQPMFTKDGYIDMDKSRSTVEPTILTNHKQAEYVNKVSVVGPMKRQECFSDTPKPCAPPVHRQDEYIAIDKSGSMVEATILTNPNEAETELTSLSPTGRPPPRLVEPSSSNDVTISNNNNGGTTTIETINNEYVTEPMNRQNTSNPPISNKYTSLAEVPTNINHFSVHEVANCLQLLKLDKYIDTFKKEMIDGQFLVNVLDEELLKDVFNFKTLEAKKLVQFAKNGWRPKIGQ